jgi:hypothetical protein
MVSYILYNCPQLVKQMAEESLIEKLAELEHNQWLAWARSVLASWRAKLSYQLEQKWERNDKPYSELTEKEKEKDRE